MDFEPAVRLCANSQSDAVRYSMQPTADRFLLGYRARFAGQDQEGRLKAVLGVVLIPQHPPANAQNHRTVSLHKFDKRSLFAQIRKPPQEMAVAWFKRQPNPAQPPKLPQNGAQRNIGHEFDPFAA